MYEHIPFWQVPLSELLTAFSSRYEGLSTQEVAQNYKQYGPNLNRPSRRSFLFAVLTSKFKSPLVLLLVTAAFCAKMVGESKDFWLILTILIVSVLIDVFQEIKAHRAVEGLNKLVATHARVLRNNKKQNLTFEQLVPGDVIELAAGELVPADGRVLLARDFFVNQTFLTGESQLIEKKPGDTLLQEAQIAHAENSVFAGSSVISGWAQVLVCRTGKHTVFSSITRTAEESRPSDLFFAHLQKFGFLLMRWVGILLILVLIVGVANERDWPQMLLFATALAVGMAPEFLPMVASIILAKGARNLGKKKVIVKKHTSVYGLGGIDVLCSDKTGTLTKGVLQVSHWCDVDGTSADEVFQWVYINSFFEEGFSNPIEQAILDYKTLDLTGWRKLDEIPFDFHHRRIAVLVEKNQKRYLVVKSSLDEILNISTHYVKNGAAPKNLNAEQQARLHAMFQDLSEQGFKVHGIAIKQHGRSQITHADETGMSLVGYICFSDEPKYGCAEALEKLRQIGITIKIITGDNEHVTRHLCQLLGISENGLLVGSDMRDLSPEALKEAVMKVNLFCQILPEQKQAIVRALKEHGHTVGYMGDGINDIPALREADVSISVDEAAPAVREASHLVLLEKDLRVLYEGVLEGRRTFANIMKYIKMSASANLGNMFSMAVAALAIPFLPMLPPQILLNNLLYDCVSMAIATDRVDPPALIKFIKWNTANLSRFMLLFGGVSSCFDVVFFGGLFWYFGVDETHFQTAWFVESLVTQVLVVFIIRTWQSPLFSLPSPVLIGSCGLITVVAFLLPALPIGKYFGFQPLPVSLFGFIGCVAGCYLVAIEGIKRIFLRRWGRI